MKKYEGKSIKGFRFEDGFNGVNWLESNEKYIGQVGRIVKQFEYKVKVRFSSRYAYYPISLIERNLLPSFPVIPKIIQWANDRNIIQGSTPIKQSLKTLEECAELIEAVADNDKEAISDAIGDICVTLVNQCEMQGLDFLECIEKAYEVIKDRKGRMVNGKFEKEL